MSEGVKFIEWKNAYSVKVSAIDEQHKQVLNILNSVFTSIKHRDNSKALSFNLKKLSVVSQR